MYMMVRVFTIIVACGGVLLFADPVFAVNCDKNPTHPQCGGGEPPAPPPDGAACTNSNGVFPAFAYTKQIITGSRRKEKVTSEIYLTNSTADCSIMIFSEDDGLGDMEYIQRADGEGRIVWGQHFEEGKGKNQRSYDALQMVTFNVDVVGRSITTTLPLTDSTIYTLPEGGFNDKEFSPDGDRLYFAVEEPSEDSDGSFVWLNSLNFVDISNCDPDCPVTEKFLLFPDEGIASIAVNPEKNRIYFSSHDRIPDVYRLSFTEKDEAGNWSTPTNIVTSEDNGYSACFGSYIDADIWPESDQSYTGEIVAMVMSDCGLGGIHVFHVENCVVDTTPSCFSQGRSPVVRIIARTALPVFTSIPIGLVSVPLPSLLLYTFTADGIFNYNLNTGFEESVLQTLTLQEIHFPHPAD